MEPRTRVGDLAIAVVAYAMLYAAMPKKGEKLEEIR
jgi:hypothetical protein